MERYFRQIEGLRVLPEMEPAAIRQALAEFDFEHPRPPEEALQFAVSGLERWQAHVGHPRYFGLFNPATTAMGVAADALVAAYNPQLAAWSHSPFAIEVERHLIRFLGRCFGYSPQRIDGTFCAGGAEANHTGLLLALGHHFPEVSRHGLRAVREQPLLYVSSQGHHSVAKAARLCGLGAAAVVEATVGRDLRLDVGRLAERMARDRDEGARPFLVVATAGSTGAGTIDPLDELADFCAEEGLWLHVDAAWGGAAVLAPELANALEGIARADSITFDAHKWPSVPMGAGVLLTRHAGALERTFSLAADYMPREAQGLDVVEPHRTSMQWSRRFVGLKLFLSLAVAGRSGYADLVRWQSALGDELRRRLAAAGWEIVNLTPLPVVCFVDGTRPDGGEEGYLGEVATRCGRGGETWISTVRLGPLGPALRACITSWRTREEDLDRLAGLLEVARREIPPVTAVD